MKQKKLLVEDYAQKFRDMNANLNARLTAFRDLNARLTTVERPTHEMLGEYFCKVLWKNRSCLVASIAIPIRVRVDSISWCKLPKQCERRLGQMKGSRKKKKKKKKQSSNSETDSDDDPNLDSESDTDMIVMI